MTDETPTVETPPKKGHAWVRLFVDWGGPTCFLLTYFAVFLGIIPTSDHGGTLAGECVSLATVRPWADLSPPAPPPPPAPAPP